MDERLATLNIADWLLIGGMVGVIVFTLFYGLRSRWYKWVEGRALFAKSAALALVSLNTVAFIVFGEYPYRDYVRFFIYLAFFCSSWFFVVALIRRQNLAARDANEERVRLLAELEEAERREG